MKITLNVNDALLARVMAAFGVGSKTHAIDLALREAERKLTMRALAKEGLGLNEVELGNVFDPDYDLMAARIAEGPGTYGKTSASDAPSERVPMVRKPTKYGRKSGSGR